MPKAPCSQSMMVKSSPAAPSMSITSGDMICDQVPSEEPLASSDWKEMRVHGQLRYITAFTAATMSGAEGITARSSVSL